MAELIERHRSTLVFARGQGDAWTVLENRFEGPFIASQTGDLAGAELAWSLDASGLPEASPQEKGHAKPNILTNLSMFAFRPVGIVLASTCAGDRGAATWKDSIARVRTVEFRVLEGSDLRVLLHVKGSVQTSVNRWDFEGEMTVSLEDGLTSDMRVHEMGPGAPKVNDRERIVRVARE
jgi:hypothetical protein